MSSRGPGLTSSSGLTHRVCPGGSVREQALRRRVALDIDLAGALVRVSRYAGKRSRKSIATQAFSIRSAIAGDWALPSIRSDSAGAGEESRRDPPLLPAPALSPTGRRSAASGPARCAGRSGRAGAGIPRVA